MPLLSFTLALVAAPQQTWENFETRTLNEQFYAEGACGADFDGDGVPDVQAGPFIYFGPDYAAWQKIYSQDPYDIQGYSDHFFSYAHDFDGDGDMDILRIGFPGKRAEWYENPGPDHVRIAGAAQWTRYLAFEGVDNESPDFADVNGDGQPELICMFGGQLGWADYDAANPGARWTFHPVSEDGQGQRYTHGLGYGDIDGDGRTDLLLKHGWWQQPESLQGDPKWAYHPFTFSSPGGAQMLVFDVDGDGDSDVITSDHAHGYGLSWFEQKAGDGAIDFTRHKITGAASNENPYGVAIGNLHALVAADMNGDGLTDFVTGARHWAHGGGDPADHDVPVVYWFELERDTAGVRFVPHLIHVGSGIGTQIGLHDLDGNSLPDVLISNKKGSFVHLHKRETVSASERRTRLASEVREARQRDVHARPSSVLPRGADGNPLNLGFETGDLTNWTVEGEAFAKQPVAGDTVITRRPPDRSRHHGEYWIGTYEVGYTDGPTGTLTSEPFSVTHPFASFLVGGGHHSDTCVELLDVMGRVFYRASGRDDENMHVQWVDLRERMGQPISIRLQDQQTGHWGHVNFDDFRFHHETEEVLRRAVQGMESSAVRGKLPEEAAEAMTVPEGFSVDLIAAEPDLHQPIQFTIDEKGRIWVVEAYAYPQRRLDEEAHDTILVLEDTNGDGNFDKKTTFYDKLNLVSGLEVGFGGVWVGAAPYLMFIPDADGDLVPDSEPQILLDGWGYEDTHETLNAFRWGPDGWLYGCHGVFTHSRVGKPGTPDEQREPLNAGVWRYHPIRHEFEIYAWGSSNPWGVDWDDWGRPVITACVIPHLYHVIQGARYFRQSGQHFSPYIYEDITTVADHLHYIGDTPYAETGVSESVGGGHAHCGAVIYLSEQFPEMYRNRLFMFNIHGKRINSEILASSGSGIVGRHAPDFLFANDPWFMCVALRTGPDGSMYIIDWYDKQACHRNEPGIWDRSNGRMYRIRYGDGDFSRVDLASWSEDQLVDAVLSKNEWEVRTARRMLMERGVGQAGAKRLRAIATDTQLEVPQRLRAMWAIHVTGVWQQGLIKKLLNDSDEHIRSWTISLALDAAGAKAYGRAELPNELVKQLAKAVRRESSPVVRLAYASALQRMPLQHRWSLVEALVSFAEDNDDHNLPKMVWYGFEPCVATDPARALKLAANSCKLDFVQQSVFRRLAEGNAAMLEALTAAIAKAKPTQAEAMLAAMAKGLASRPETPMPQSWPKVSRRVLNPNSSYSRAAQDQVLALALQFGDGSASEALARVALDSKQSPDRRTRALEAMGTQRDAMYADVLLELLDEASMRTAALERMPAVNDHRVALRLLQEMNAWPDMQQDAAAAVLASRPATAKSLLDAIDQGKVPTRVLDFAPLRRQLGELNSQAVSDQLAKLWGKSEALSEDSATRIAAWKSKLTADSLSNADLSNGRAVYRRTCYACHTLFGDGQQIGPDITGSNRGDLDYILSNLIEPSAEVGMQYMMSIARLQDGRVVSGMIAEQNDQTLTFRNGALTQVVKRSELAKRPDGTVDLTQLETSLMPSGQLDGLSDSDARDLIAYLASPTQQPLPADASNVSSWFDGQSLDGWHYDPDVWSVENGEIVGRAPNGIDHNTWATGPLQFTDFRMTVEVKLVDDTGNSGIQFRSSRGPDGEVSGLQADIGQGWWGKLYEEHGRGLLDETGAAEHVRRGEWNSYEIVAVGNHVLIALNGHKIVDVVDDQFARRGIVALQLHSGGPTEIRFRSFDFELSPPAVLRTVNQ